MPKQTSVTSKYARALANPVRLGIVASLAHGPRTVDSLARQLDVKKERVSRHARALAGMGLVRAVADRPRTYELLREPIMWEQVWEQLPVPARRESIATALADLHSMTSAAVDAGGFDRPDSCLTRHTVRMSDALWDDVVRQFSDLLRQLGAAEDDPEGTPATVVTMLFSGEHADTAPADSPPPAFDDAEARERTYEIVEEIAETMALDDPLPWDRFAALFEQGRLLARAAASLEDARRPARADR